MSCPRFTFMYASRNDSYEGDSPARLFASLFALLEALSATPERLQDLAPRCEIVVVDWNSDMPLLANPHADRIRELVVASSTNVRFIVVSPDAVDKVHGTKAVVQMSEVHALNLAASVAMGDFLLRLDQDTVVGDRFLDFLRDATWATVRRPWWCGRRETTAEQRDDMCRDPNGFVRLHGDTCPLFGTTPTKNLNGMGAVGVMGLSRHLWLTMGGYDETMMFRAHMEIDVALRLAVNGVSFYNIHEEIDTDFYHIWHTTTGARQINEVPTLERAMIPLPPIDRPHIDYMEVTNGAWTEK